MTRDPVVSSAIRFRTKGESDFHIVVGRRHPDCIKQFRDMGLPAAKRDMGAETQGFLTQSGKFVDRKQALAIAEACGQLKGGTHALKDELISEDVW